MFKKKPTVGPLSPSLRPTLTAPADQIPLPAPLLGPAQARRSDHRGPAAATAGQARRGRAARSQSGRGGGADGPTQRAAPGERHGGALLDDGRRRGAHGRRNRVRGCAGAGRGGAGAVGQGR